MKVSAGDLGERSSHQYLLPNDHSAVASESQLDSAKCGYHEIVAPATLGVDAP